MLSGDLSRAPATKVVNMLSSDNLQLGCDIIEQVGFLIPTRPSKGVTGKEGSKSQHALCSCRAISSLGLRVGLRCGGGLLTFVEAVVDKALKDIDESDTKGADLEGVLQGPSRGHRT